MHGYWPQPSLRSEFRRQSRVVAHWMTVYICGQCSEMVNYHDPVVVAQDYIALSKLWHAVAGIYFWEFVTTLDYEWSVFRWHRPLRWTIWIYVTTRIATLLVVVLSLVAINVTARYNCKIEIIFGLIFGFLAAATASLLIVLRILAIWNMKKVVVAIATGAWGACFIFQIQAIGRIRVQSIPGKATCVVANPHITNLNTVVGFTTDIILLLIMFFGLFRLHFHKSSAFGVGRVLWRQGLVWLLAAFIADIIPVVIICLNLNDPIDDMCMTPPIVALSIAATRIHRGLVDYASVECTEHHNNANGRTEWKANRAPITRAQLGRTEVAIPEMYEHDEKTQMGQHDSAGSFIDVEGQLYGKPARQPSFDENVGNCMGSATGISVT